MCCLSYSFSSMLFVFSFLSDSKSSFAVLHSKSETALKTTIWEKKNHIDATEVTAPPVFFANPQKSPLTFQCFLSPTCPLKPVSPAAHCAWEAYQQKTLVSLTRCKRWARGEACSQTLNLPGRTLNFLLSWFVPDLGRDQSPSSAACPLCSHSVFKCSRSRFTLRFTPLFSEVCLAAAFYYLSCL